MLDPNSEWDPMTKLLSNDIIKQTKKHFQTRLLTWHIAMKYQMGYIIKKERKKGQVATRFMLVFMYPKDVCLNKYSISSSFALLNNGVYTEKYLNGKRRLILDEHSNKLVPDAKNFIRYIENDLHKKGKQILIDNGDLEIPTFLTEETDFISTELATSRYHILDVLQNDPDLKFGKDRHHNSVFNDDWTNDLNDRFDEKFEDDFTDDFEKDTAETARGLQDTLRDLKKQQEQLRKEFYLD